MSYNPLLNFIISFGSCVFTTHSEMKGLALGVKSCMLFA